jgi:phosphatidylserine/phosphatidylglycerophosphate/cardiolipin synthase-like enzyme
MRTLRTPFATAAVLAAGLFTVAGCAPDHEIEDGEADVFPSGKADGGVEEGSREAAGILALANGAPFDELDGAVGLSRRAAEGIAARRPFATLAELDAVPYVGPAALDALLDYARDAGLVVEAATIEVVFSPQPASTTHSKRVAAMIAEAQHTIDVAMYSMSDADVSAALKAAAARGVRVRFLFETANADRKLDAAARAASKSGKLERDGVDVRWVNKILHHKLAIVDGARVVTGSANWSFGGAQVFDENTLFVDGSPELAAAYRREFELLWSHSTDFAIDPATARPMPAPEVVADAPDDPDLDVVFTSANFTVQPGSPTFRIDRTKTTVSDQLVAAIGRARTSIHIATGHLRLRPVAEALIAAKQAHPALDIKLYLDQQEYISASGDLAQRREVEECLAAATTDAARWSCTSRDFLFGKEVGDAGIQVRYKTYSYRWDYSYAPQMHDKYVLIDGAELWSGSYNLSMNAEQATFENVVHLRGAAYAGVVAAFERDFERLWGQGAGALAGLRDTISTDDTIPIVFGSMALSWQEVTDLRALIRSRCPAVDSEPFRTDPAAHRTCTR